MTARPSSTWSLAISRDSEISRKGLLVGSGFVLAACSRFFGDEHGGHWYKRMLSIGTERSARLDECSGEDEIAEVEILAHLSCGRYIC